MKSFISDALARAGPAAAAEMAPSYQNYSAEDEELERILASLKTNIKIVGCGGGGSNTIDRMTEAGILGAELYAANTDAQHLLAMRAPHKILLGRRSTRGLGAGALPQVGEEAAREAEEELKKALNGADIVFITAGLGGGTGTGSAPFVAQLAKDMGALTICVCTSPFKAEGAIRMENAEWGLERLRNVADTVIVIPNDKLLELVPRLSLNAAFKVADEVLVRAIKGITELITKPGLVNLDFNDLRTIMKGAGVAMIGLGEGEDDDRIDQAVNEAINSPLIDVDITGAAGALINVTGGESMTVSEAERVAEIIQAKISPNARIIWGAAIDHTLQDKVRVMVVITGVKSKHILGPVETAKPKGSMEVDFIR
ncbi:MAG TPA: cell division protein FtsZ [Methanomassiliicoccales archaeon]|nr:cell division protein FtsZ [Methanomassiliicoccales archaeon]